jgi:hypothetical protein
LKNTNFHICVYSGKSFPSFCETKIVHSLSFSSFGSLYCCFFCQLKLKIYNKTENSNFYSSTHPTLLSFNFHHLHSTNRRDETFYHSSFSHHCLLDKHECQLWNCRPRLPRDNSKSITFVCIIIFCLFREHGMRKAHDKDEFLVNRKERLTLNRFLILHHECNIIIHLHFIICYDVTMWI